MESKKARFTSEGQLKNIRSFDKSIKLSQNFKEIKQ